MAFDEINLEDGRKDGAQLTAVERRALKKFVRIVHVWMSKLENAKTVGDAKEAMAYLDKEGE